ncbi:amidase family protein [Pseudidiomarina aquimaris]|uniref:amidase family protein n=1 Tax=Pseudidiomarina aquimaris TaxID=641841 RepID=UPI003A97A671
MLQSLTPNATGKYRGPMHGIPVLLKTTLIQLMGWQYCRFYLLRDHMPPDDAFIVQQLRDAGAIILVKPT